MENPFEKLDGENTYTDNIFKQINMPIGESRQIDLHKRSIRVCRMTIQYIQHKYGTKYRTKKDSQGNLWVKRIG